jgi:tRNA uridine 5-carboxymethylaminomethyl modification enzyme
MLENSNLDFTKKCSRLIRRWKSKGIRTSLGIEIKAKSVVLTNGTFLNGKIIMGKNNLVEVELEKVLLGITEDLINAGFEAGRMKTELLKVDGRSLDFSKMNEEKEMPDQISFLIRI